MYGVPLAWQSSLTRAPFDETTGRYESKLGHGITAPSRGRQSGDLFCLQLSAGRNVRQSPIVEVDFVGLGREVPLLNLGVSEKQEHRGSPRRHPGRQEIGCPPPFKCWLQYYIIHITAELNDQSLSST